MDGLTDEGQAVVCPECVAGKHQNCDGTGWDFELDERTVCVCTHDGEED